jgi:serine/threonine-protein kinase
MPDLLERLRSSIADRYAIDHEIGRGGMAVVFLAEDLKHHRKVAIKVLHPGLAAAIGPDRFLREIEAVAGLTHPHVLPLHDSGEADGLLYYVMPYVEGESLRHRLEREKQLPVDEAIRITQEIAEALDHAHRHGLIHRDIKPGNILLEEGHAVVTDFGVARAINVAGAEKVTATGMAVGTPAYMSPEQATGEEVDERSDLYSLGCVAYEMLSGEPPLVGPTPQSTAAKRLTDRPTPLPALRDTVSPGLSQVVETALSRNPVDRYATVTEFSAALGRSLPAEKDLATRRRKLKPRLVLGAAVLASFVVLGLVLRFGPWSSDRDHPRTAIAVLPFENLSAGGPYDYFASGIHDELLTQLSKMGSLTVISRTSVRAYAGTSLPTSRIAEELGVGSIVEGSVQVVGDRLRVNVQLIDASTAGHLWAESYDRTMDGAFAIQSDVVQRVVTAVGGTLAESARRSLGAAPTSNPEAYRLYLQGREYQHRPAESDEDLFSAQRLYEHALALDPQFALAHAALSEVHGMIYWLKYDPLPTRLEAQLSEARTALRLDPDLPEGHLATGFWYYVARRDWSAALEEYETARRGMPNDAHVIKRIGYTYRRMGNWDGVFGELEKATRVEPRNAELFYDLAGLTHDILRHYSAAIEAYDRASSFAPDHYDAAINKGFSYLNLTGQFDTLRTVLSQIPQTEPAWYHGTVSLLMLERDADSVLQALRSQRVSPIQERQDFFIPTSLTAAQAHLLTGDVAAAHAAFDSALVVLDSAINLLPHDWRVHASRGRALAGLGRLDEALLEAEWLRGSEPYRHDAFRGPDVGDDRAAILVAAGEHEAALDEIERLLSMPAWLSVQHLRLSPTWDPLRNYPRFQRLVEE